MLFLLKINALLRKMSAPVVAVAPVWPPNFPEWRWVFPVDASRLSFDRDAPLAVMSVGDI